MHAEPELTLTSTYHPCNQVTGILRGHLAAALGFLHTAKPSGASIHAARQKLKRARAMLRLLRTSVDREQFRLEDATLREAAHQLNDVRDAEVLVRVFSRLRNAIKDAPRRADLEPLRKLLLRERRNSASNALRETLAAAKRSLQQAKERTRDWSVANDVDLLTSAMRKTYRKGRACYRAVCESATDEHLHAWRRQVKYSAYQLEALGSLAPARMTKKLRKSAQLAKQLGRDHDLCMLRGRIADAHLAAAANLRLTAVIRRKRADLQRRALQRGKRLYRGNLRKFRPFN